MRARLPSSANRMFVDEDAILEPRTVGEATYFYCRRDSKDYDDCQAVIEGQRWSKRVVLRPGETWLDIGAHIGSFSVQAAKLGIRIHAFEPEEFNYGLLMKNTVLNKVADRVTAYKVAVSGHVERTLPFYMNRCTSRGAHTIIRHSASRQIIEVRNVHVTNLLDQIKPHGIKIDVEGAEYEIIGAIEPRQWKRVNQITLEYHFHKLKDTNLQRYRLVVGILQKHFPLVAFCPFDKVGKRGETFITARK